MDKIEALKVFLRNAQKKVRDLPVEQIVIMSCYMIVIRSYDLQKPMEGILLKRGETVEVPPFSVKFTRPGILRIDCRDGKNRWTCPMKMNSSIEKEGCYLGVFSSENKAKRWAMAKVHELRDST